MYLIDLDEEAFDLGGKFVYEVEVVMILTTLWNRKRVFVRFRVN